MDKPKSNTLLIAALVVVALVLIVGAFIFGYTSGVRAASSSSFGQLTVPVSENPFAFRNPFEYQNPFK